jgi:AcrR family transcriptional regulator
MNSDRRVKRSKKMIEKFIIKLLKTKKIDQITVKELCEMCDVNRGTFYNHYSDLYDLMAQIENSLVQELELTLSKYSPQQINEDTLPLFKEILSFIDQKADIVTILFRDNEDSLFLNKIINLFRTKAINSWGKIYNCCNSKNYSYFLEYAIHGCLGIINKWLKDGRKDDLDDLAELLEKVVINGTNFLK